MLDVSRVLVRDRATRALLFVVDTKQTPVRIEAAEGALRIENAANGRPVVDAPIAVLELLNDEAVQFAGAARLRGEKDLRSVLIVLELPTR